jgi:protein-disulfide isomerase
MHEALTNNRGFLMKYAQLLIGLFAGTALGGSVVAGTGVMSPGVGASDKEAMKQIVRDVIMEEPKLIIDSVQKMQIDQQKMQEAARNDVLKDPAVREQVFNDPNAPSIGPKDSKRVVVEFFDYNCGACKMMYKSIDAVIKKDPLVRVVFHEFPIFGPSSETNSKIGLAVNRLYPDKYFDFHIKMISYQGRVDEKTALDFVQAAGMDAAKVKAESETKAVADILESNRKLGEKLGANPCYW